MGKALEVGVEGNDAAVPETGEGGKVAVRPEMVRKIRYPGKGHEFGIDFRGILNEGDMGFGPVTLVDVPGFDRRQGAAEHLRVGAEAKKAQRRDPTEGDFWGGLLLPVMARSFVLGMIFVHQGEPDVDIGKVRHGWSRRAWVAARLARTSSSSSRVLS